MSFYLQIVKNIPATVNRIESDVNVFSVVAKRADCNGDQRIIRVLLTTCVIDFTLNCKLL